MELEKRGTEVLLQFFIGGINRRGLREEPIGVTHSIFFRTVAVALGVLGRRRSGLLTSSTCRLRRAL